MGATSRTEADKAKVTVRAEIAAAGQKSLPSMETKEDVKQPRGSPQ